MMTLLWRGLFLALLIAAPVVQAADVAFNITGSLKYSPCTVTVGASQNVALGMYSTNFLGGVGETTPLKPFEITVDNCPKNYNDVQVTFEGDVVAENTQLIALQPGGAKNVGIILYDSDKKTVIPVNSATAGKRVSTDQATTLTFYAAYMSTGKVSDGSANADVSFTISYN
ncbi:fimbrial protein [Yersinia hibernica]|uniref:Type 1 fimbrial protein n=1 Tax=Yersinia enterocolitica LC20 TaxID=1443113 RepID=A0A7U4GGY4_YEREN|nr:fimbrial protein [Yersinia hibernica]AHM75046.1 type 1 fimbrial protein [Yersinia hibernica]OVZ90851.1 type 1 fimbrial protein [Yersinia kristensenii]